MNLVNNQISPFYLEVFCAKASRKMIDNLRATQNKRHIFYLEKSGKLRENETKDLQWTCDC